MKFFFRMQVQKADCTIGFQEPILEFSKSCIRMVSCYGYRFAHATSGCYGSGAHCFLLKCMYANVVHPQNPPKPTAAFVRLLLKKANMCCVPAYRKPLLSKKNKARRLEFARQHLVYNWKDVIFWMRKSSKFGQWAKSGMKRLFENVFTMH